jgi:hypothetical protein
MGNVDEESYIDDATLGAPSSMSLVKEVLLSTWDSSPLAEQSIPRAEKLVPRSGQLSTAAQDTVCDSETACPDTHTQPHPTGTQNPLPQPSTTQDTKPNVPDPATEEPLQANPTSPTLNELKAELRAIVVFNTIAPSAEKADLETRRLNLIRRIRVAEWHEKKAREDAMRGTSLPINSFPFPIPNLSSPSFLLPKTLATKPNSLQGETPPPQRDLIPW